MNLGDVRGVYVDEIGGRPFGALDLGWLGSTTKERYGLVMLLEQSRASQEVSSVHCLQRER